MRKVWIIASSYTNLDGDCAADYWDGRSWTNEITRAHQYPEEKSAKEALSGKVKTRHSEIYEVKPIYTKK